jgi:hypothetical protein
MKRGITTALLLASWLGVVPFASAQFGTLGQAPARPRPTVSPFINQGTGGINAFNYYGVIKPQFETNRQFNEMQQRLNVDGSLRSPLQTPQDTPNALGGLQTGHTSTFFNYGRYFPNSPPMGGGSGIGNTTGFGLGGVGAGLGVNPNNNPFYNNFMGRGSDSPRFGLIAR